MSNRSPKTFYLFLALAVLVLDQTSKWLVETYLNELAPRVVIPHLLNLTYVRNTGVAFGLFASGGNRLGTLLLTLLGIVALVVVGVYFKRTPNSQRLLLSALGLILGGAVGNLTDRILSGAVTDFIDFYWGTYHFHTFNLADSAITVGICLMFLDMFVSRHEEVDQGDGPETEGVRPSSI